MHIADFLAEELLRALDSQKFFGAAIDVTDPEPLPPNHPLWSHPKCVITPHLSGDTEGQYDIATDILLENVRRMEAGEQLVNLIDLEKGY
jgi:phosphoglycerate dehydrogenase-like enzyme